MSGEGIGDQAWTTLEGAIDRTLNTKLGNPISAQMFGLQRSQAITAFLFLKQEVSLPI